MQCKLHYGLLINQNINTQSWSKKFFFHLTDLGLLNAHAINILHSETHDTIPELQLKVLYQLLEKHHQVRKCQAGDRPSKGA
jgi:hypothetical protein